MKKLIVSLFAALSVIVTSQTFAKIPSIDDLGTNSISVPPVVHVDMLTLEKAKIVLGDSVIGGHLMISKTLLHIAKHGLPDPASYSAHHITSANPTEHMVKSVLVMIAYAYASTNNKITERQYQNFVDKFAEVNSPNAKYVYPLTVNF